MERTKSPASIRLEQTRPTAPAAQPSALPFAWIEDLSTPRHLEQQIGRLKTAGEPRVQILEALHYDLDAECVHVAEWSAAERWESNTKHRADVAVAWRLDDSIAETTRRFVEHRQYCALLD